MKSPPTETPRYVVLLRHGHAVDGATDFERPLSKHGRRDVQQSAAELVAWTPASPHIVCSSARRALETAEIIASALQVGLDARADLYLAEPELYVRALASQSDAYTTLILVGHNPGLSELATRLKRTPCSLATAAYCVHECHGSWRDWGTSQT